MKKAEGEAAAAEKAKAPRPRKAAATKAPAKKSTKPAAPKAAVKKTPAKAPAKKAAPKSRPADLAHVVAAAAMEHKLINPVLLDVTGLSSVADWFFIATAENPRQMSATIDKIIRRAREHGWRALGREGQMSDKWALVDLGNIIVHLFSPDARELYDLEGLWADARRV